MRRLSLVHAKFSRGESAASLREDRLTGVRSEAPAVACGGLTVERIPFGISFRFFGLLGGLALCLVSAPVQAQAPTPAEAAPTPSHRSEPDAEKRADDAAQKTSNGALNGSSPGSSARSASESSSKTASESSKKTAEPPSQTRKPGPAPSASDAEPSLPHAGEPPAVFESGRVSQPTDRKAAQKSASGKQKNQERDARRQKELRRSSARRRGRRGVDAQKPMRVQGLSIRGRRRRVERTGSTHSLAEKQLERLNHDDPHAVLNSVPGVYTRQEDGVGLRPNIGARGVNPDRTKKVNLTEDGILLGPAPYTAPAAYYFPLVTRMESLRIIKGPPVLAFGPQNVAAAVNLVTRSIPTEFKLGADLAAGQYGYRKGHFHAGTTWNGLGLLIEGVRLQSTGFKELDGGGDTGFVRNEAMFKASYVFNEQGAFVHRLGLKLGYSDETSNETYLGLTDEDFAANPLRRYAASALDRMEWDRTQFTLHHDVESKRFKLRTTVYRHDLSRIWRKVNGVSNLPLLGVLGNPRSPSSQLAMGALTGSRNGSATIRIGPNDRNFVSQGIQSVGTVKLRSRRVRQEIDFGVRFHMDEAERLHTEDAFSFQGAIPGVAGSGTLVQSIATPTVNADDTARTYALAAFVSDEIRIGNSTTVTPVARMENIRSEFDDRFNGRQLEDSYTVFLPGLGLTQKILPFTYLIAGAYSGFSPSSPRQNDVDPERSTNFEGGVRHQRRWGRLELIGFWNEYSNITNTCTSSNGCPGARNDLQTDAGRARIAGLEAFAQAEKRFGKTLIPLTLAYTYTSATFKEDFTSSDPIWGDVQKGDPIPYIPAHQLNLSVGVERPTFGFNASYLYVESLDEGVLFGTTRGRTDALNVVDVSAHVRLPYGITLYGVVRNALNSLSIVSRRPFGARPNAPRWAQVGLRFDY